MTKIKKSDKPIDFEQALAELNQIVEQMEHGNLSLEDSLKNFEQGIYLARTCQGALKAAEQKVQILMEQNGQIALTPFSNQNDVDDES